ncbi:RING1 and YY1-binding protein A [Rhipicephalus sanguineus]|uniref:RanBP2-type domain-containing protein n=4 Tax=Rhipicephalus TaxID=426455 RepID=A0A9D4QCI8_RHISA|nr:RING1 and YY1-binding protein A [Rhipicephalus sanguineus]KAH7975330.1 hypothetical protein HPB52_000591 [Rhipicephalus sanguineus]
MDSKKSPNRRPKRQAPPSKEEQVWDCSVCTYRNTAEAFKCLMCDVRKGTSTRKPRLNAQLVAQQLGPSSGRRGSSSRRGSGGPGGDSSNSSRGTTRPRLKNVDRSSGQQRAVTVNNVTVIITEFQPKRLSDASSSTDGAHSDGHAEAR